MKTGKSRLRRISYETDVRYQVLYDLAAIELNHEAYAEHGEVVVSSSVRRLLRVVARVRDTAIQHIRTT
jgi:hypothetical protein